MEADPKIDRDNPPDLSKYTVAAEPKPEAGAAAAGAAAVAAAAPAPAAAAAPAKAAAGKAAGGKAAAGAKAAAAQAPSAYEQLQTATDVIQQTELLMDKVGCVGVFQSWSSQLCPWYGPVVELAPPLVVPFCHLAHPSLLFAANAT